MLEDYGILFMLLWQRPGHGVTTLLFLSGLSQMFMESGLSWGVGLFFVLHSGFGETKCSSTQPQRL